MFASQRTARLPMRCSLFMSTVTNPMWNICLGLSLTSLRWRPSRSVSIPSLPSVKSVNQSALLPAWRMSWASLSLPSLTSRLSRERRTLHETALPAAWRTSVLMHTCWIKLSGNSVNLNAPKIEGVLMSMRTFSVRHESHYQFLIRSDCDLSMCAKSCIRTAVCFKELKY